MAARLEHAERFLFVPRAEGMDGQLERCVRASSPNGEVDQPLEGVPHREHGTDHERQHDRARPDGGEPVELLKHDTDPKHMACRDLSPVAARHTRGRSGAFMHSARGRPGGIADCPYLRGGSMAASLSRFFTTRPRRRPAMASAAQAPSTSKIVAPTTPMWKGSGGRKRASVFSAIRITRASVGPIHPYPNWNSPKTCVSRYTLMESTR